jgi:hypothetical protein
MRKIILSLSLISSFFYTEAQTTTSTTQSTDDKVKNLSTLMAAMPKITGFLDLRYQYSNEANNYASGRNGFDVRRVYLGMSGAVTKDLTYRVLADFETTPKILDALVEYKPLSFLSVQAGQFKVPLTLENPYSPATLETAEFSQAVTALVTDIDGNKNNGRDIGIGINGSALAQKGFNLIEYKLAVLNGNVINAVDNNKSKDYLATLYINALKPLTIGGSYYTGKYGPEATKYTRDRYSVGAKYDDGKLLVRSEYIAGKTAAIESKGFYASAAYYVTKKIQPVLKYDTYKSNSAVATTPITNYIAGVNYWITPKSRVQLNYTHKDYKDTSKSDYDCLVAQLLVSF